MQLVVWNSQGDCWDPFWTNFVEKVASDNANDDVLGLLLESSRASWSVDVVHVNNRYDYPTTDKNPTVDAGRAAASRLCKAIVKSNDSYTRSPAPITAYWFPWVKNPDKPDGDGNPRCSLGGIIWKRTNRSFPVNRHLPDEAKRPIVHINVQKTSSGTDNVVLLQVHLTATDATARNELTTLMKGIKSLIPESTAAFIVGDMNIDLRTKAFNVEEGWKVVKYEDQPTQRAGGQLDWGLLYDPNKKYGGVSASVLKQYDSFPNTSDHSVMQYDFPLPE